MSMYGISSWIVARLPLEGAVDELAAAGFRQLELSDDTAPLVRAWETKPIETTERLSLAGLTIASMHSPVAGRYLDLVDEGDRLASIAANVDYLRKMAASEVGTIIIHPCAGFWAEGTAEGEAAARRLRDSLERLTEVAVDLGLFLAVENLYPPLALGSTVASLLETIEELGEHVGLCLDIGHTAQAGLDLRTELQTALASGQLSSLHLHDVNEENHDHFIPGEGRLEFAPLLRALDAAEFDGLRTLEIRPTELEVEATTRVALRRAAAVRDAWEAGTVG